MIKNLELTTIEASKLVEKGKAKYVGFLNDPTFVLEYKQKYWTRCMDKYHFLAGRKKDD